MSDWENNIINDTELTDKSFGDDGRHEVNSPKSWPALIIIGVLGLCTLILFSLRIVCATTNYRPARGLADSPFVGMQNFSRILNGPQAASVLSTSVLAAIVSAALSLLFGLLGALAGKLSRITRAAAAGLGMVLAFIPAYVWSSIFKVSPIDSSVLPLLFIWAIPRIGLSVTVGALTVRMTKSVMRAGLIMFFLSLTLGVAGFETTGISMRHLTFDSYIYRIAFQSGQYSMGAAVEVLRGLISLFFFIPGAIILAAVMLRKLEAKPASPAKKRGSVKMGLIALLSTLVVMLALGAILLNVGGASVLNNARVIRGMINSVSLSLIIILLGTGVYFVIFLLTGKLKNRSTLLFILLLAVLMPLSAFSIVKFLSARNFGLINTIFPEALAALSSPIIVLLMTALVMHRPRSPLTCLQLGGGLAALAAACAVFSTGNLYLSTSGKMPLGYLLRTSLASIPAASGEQTVNAFVAILGLAMLVSALPAAVGAMLTVSGVERE